MENIITLSVQSLFEEYNSKLTYVTIERTVSENQEYYDMYCNGDLVCMDGESCKIINRENGNVTLLNEEGERPRTFVLTEEELGLQ